VSCPNQRGLLLTWNIKEQTDRRENVSTKPNPRRILRSFRRHHRSLFFPRKLFRVPFTRRAAFCAKDGATAHPRSAALLASLSQLRAKAVKTAFVILSVPRPLFLSFSSKGVDSVPLRLFLSYIEQQCKLRYFNLRRSCDKNGMVEGLPSSSGFFRLGPCCHRGQFGWCTTDEGQTHRRKTGRQRTGWFLAMLLLLPPPLAVCFLAFPASARAVAAASRLLRLLRLPGSFELATGRRRKRTLARFHLLYFIG